MVCDNNCILFTPVPKQNLDCSHLCKQCSLLPGDPGRILGGSHLRHRAAAARVGVGARVTEEKRWHNNLGSRRKGNVPLQIHAGELFLVITTPPPPFSLVSQRTGHKTEVEGVFLLS